MSVSVEGQQHAVTDLFGLGGGMPDSAYDLQTLIESITDSAKWVRTTVNTVPALRADGWDFSVDSEANARLLLLAARLGTAETVQSILSAGVSANVSAPAPAFITSYPGPALIPVPQGPPETPLQHAARRGDAAIVATLLAAGAGTESATDLGESLSNAAYGAGAGIFGRVC